MIDNIISIVKDAGDIMLSAVRPKIMEKSGHANFCTETDEKIQAYLIGRFKEVLPEAAFLGEADGQDEFASKMNSGFCFVIDPIDGTSNFIYEYRPSVFIEPGTINSEQLLVVGNHVVRKAARELKINNKESEKNFISDVCEIIDESTESEHKAAS